MSTEIIGAMILAAGGSSRLGQPKQFLLHRGETLLRRAARAALAAGCSPVVVGAGAEHARVEQELAALDVRIHHHKNWPRGIGSSIRFGVEHALALTPSLNALLVMVCDQPFVTAEILTALLSTRAQTRKPAVACAYSGTVGVPALFDRTLFRELLALPDEHGAKHLLAAWPEKTTCVPFPPGTIDIDTPADCREHLAGPAIGW